MSSVDTIQQYIDAATDLREVIRQAHEATRDLRLVVKEARELKGKLPDAAEKLISESVGEGLKQFNESLAEGINVATKAVFRRFDKIQAILMGDDQEEGLEDQVKRLMKTLSPAEKQIMYSWARLVLTAPEA